MPLIEKERTVLFAGLESRGWYWLEGTIYAPHSSMWLDGAQPWTGDLHDFHQRMTGRLQRIKQAGWLYSQENDHQNIVDDTRSLVETLFNVLSAPLA